MKKTITVILLTLATISLYSCSSNKDKVEQTNTWIIENQEIKSTTETGKVENNQTWTEVNDENVEEVLNKEIDSILKELESK